MRHIKLILAVIDIVSFHLDPLNIFSLPSGVYPSESKVVPDDLDPTTVNLDVNENPPEVTRTLSQQEEIWFNDNKESSS